MVDLADAIILRAASPLIIRVLGPTADYLGEGLKDLVAVRAENLKRIFLKARAKLDSRNNTEGEVPPRILQRILEEGSYMNDELGAEYFSGVLASSKSIAPRDDRAISLLKTLSGMSNYEIRLHYIFYRTYRNLFYGSKDLYLAQGHRATLLKVFIPDLSLNNSLALEPNENINIILEHSIPSLVNRNLIGSNYTYGPKESLQKTHQLINSGGIITHPTLLGAQLFLAAHGHLEAFGSSFCDSDLKLDDLDGIQHCAGAFHVR